MTIQQQIETIQAEYTQKMQELVAAQKWNELKEATDEFQAKLLAVSNMAVQTGPSMSLVQPQSQYYRHNECNIDLDSLVYDDDRSYFEGFMSHPQINQVTEDVVRAGAQAKKNLLKHSMRLTPGMAPKVFNCIERCRTKLGLTSKIDIYVVQDPKMNAYCYPSHEGCMYLLLTSSILEKLNEDELTFVLGHEIGHHLYQHNAMFPAQVAQILGAALSPVDVIKLFSWGRNSELTADRIGLIACGSYEAACMANFKLSSGISSDALSFQLNEYVKHYEDVANELNAEQTSMDDFYSSHPLNPLRVLALDIFSKSDTFQRFCPEITAEHTEAVMEKKIAGFMKLMEPSYLNSTDEVSRMIKEFIFLGGITIASSDGAVADTELTQIASILPGENLDTLISKVQNWTLDMMMASTNEQAEKIMPHLSQVTSCNIIRDLVIVSLVDGEFTEGEYQVLASICCMLNIHPSFIDQVINSIACQQAA